MPGIGAVPPGAPGETRAQSGGGARASARREPVTRRRRAARSDRIGRGRQGRSPSKGRPAGLPLPPHEGNLRPPFTALAQRGFPVISLPFRTLSGWRQRKQKLRTIRTQCCCSASSPADANLNRLDPQSPSSSLSSAGGCPTSTSHKRVSA